MRPDERVLPVGVASNDDGGKDEVEQADDEVRHREEHGVVPESAGDREGDAEHGGHRGEHDQPDASSATR